VLIQWGGRELAHSLESLFLGGGIKSMALKKSLPKSRGYKVLNTLGENYKERV